MDHINVRKVVLKLSNRLNLFSSTSNEVLMTSNEVFKRFRGSSVDRKKSRKAGKDPSLILRRPRSFAASSPVSLSPSRRGRDRPPRRLRIRLERPRE